MMMRCPNQTKNGPMHVIFLGNPFRQQEEFKCYTCGLKFNAPMTDSHEHTGPLGQRTPNAVTTERER